MIAVLGEDVGGRGGCAGWMESGASKWRPKFSRPEVHQRQGPIFESWLYFRSRECMITIDLSPLTYLLLALPLLAPRPEADI